jgi:hypothetical protein
MQNLRDALSSGRHKALIIDVLAACIGAVICTGLAGYFWIDTSAPASLRGDHLFMVAAAKSYINGHGFRFDAQLGFPGARDGLYFPNSDLSYRTILWLFAHVTNSPFRAVHWTYMVALATMFALAYWVLRRLGIRAWLALAGAAASVLTPYLAIRSYGHDFLALSFSVPLGLGLALELVTNRWGSSLKAFFRDPFTLTAIVVVGASGLYYTFYTLMFMAFVATAASVGERRLFPLLAAACAGALMAAIFVFAGYGLDLPLALSGQFSIVHRAPSEQLLYGLELPSAAMPFRFLHKVASGLDTAMASAPEAFAREGIAEWPAAPLTSILLAAPLIAALSFLRARNGAAAGRSKPGLIGLCAILIVFGLLFGARGGLGFEFNLLVTPEIRADSRLMPFLTFAAIVILCIAAERAAELPAPWIRIGAPILVAGLLGISIWPSRGALAHKQQAALAAPLTQALRRSLPLMLQAKDRAGLQGVLELPIAQWPETPAIHDFEPYEHQLPYVFDAPRSSTRWSYGATPAQPWYPLVSLLVNQPGAIVARARNLGFDGVLIQKRGYDAAELPPLEAELGGVGGRCRLYEDAVMALYALTKDGNGGC